MKKVLFIVLATCFFASAQAQAVYTCDFENASENALWTLTKTSNNRPIRFYPNIWRIGAAGNCAQGTAGLFVGARADSISQLNVAVASDSTSFIVAYRENISIPNPGTVYRLSFDWRANGKSNDALYVYWIPDSYSGNTNSAIPTGGIPSSSNSIAPYLLNATGLRGSSVWSTYSDTFTPTTSSGKLLFLWIQYNNGVANPPAAIDNIEITTNTPCAVPTNVKYHSSGSLSWQGNASSYDVRYTNTNSGAWTVVNGLTTTTCPITNITEGFYVFQVRANCDNGVHSQWVTVSQFAYLKGLRCLDFMDLDSTAQCYTGSANNNNYNAKATPGKVDYGYASVQSQHTIHYIPGETDERTNGGLPTVPAGEVASVRLGNWNANYGAEAIEYKLKVMPGASDILKLKYAPVLEYASHHEPGGPEHGTHGSNEQSHFYLSIMDVNGNLLDVGCSTFDFSPTPGTSDPTWHLSTFNSDQIMWKDWTEVSISLARYVGRTIIIHLATYDCTASAHFGYAYFAINCENGQLEGVSCGDFSTDHFTAPAGFKYRWYRQDDPTMTVLDTARTFNISVTDTTVYQVDIINKVNNCYYTLVANPNPRYPETKVTYNVTPKDCQNIVNFHNKSGVAYVNRETLVKTISEEEVEDIAWDFGDGSPILHSRDSVIEHIFPEEGGAYTVKVVASMSEGVCVDTVEIPINLPKLGVQQTDIKKTICFGEKFPFFDVDADTTGIYTKTHPVTSYGCDSLTVLDLTVLPENKVTFSDTIICDGESIIFGKQKIVKSGVYTEVFTSAAGCDSTATWKIKVMDPILPVVKVTEIVEDDDLGAFSISGTGYTYFTLNGVRYDASVDSIGDLEPDTYVFAFYDSLSCEKMMTFSLNPGCVANLVYQRWNDVLSVKKPEYANGRAYAKYQWRKNGVDVLGATKSYYYAGQYPDYEPDGHLDMTAYYEVAVAVDSLPSTEWQFTCPYRPIWLVDAIEEINEDVMLSPTALKGGAKMWLRTEDKARVECYSTSGVKVFSQDVSTGRTTLEAPAVPGMYVVTVYTSRSKKSIKICVTD